MKFLLKLVIGVALMNIVQPHYNTFSAGYLVGVFHMSACILIDMLMENKNDET